MNDRRITKLARRLLRLEMEYDRLTSAVRQNLADSDAKLHYEVGIRIREVAEELDAVRSELDSLLDYFVDKNLADV